MKTAFFEMEKWEETAFAGLSATHDVLFSADALNESNAHEYADVEILSPFIYSRLTRAAIEKMPKLKMIATRSTGFDHIDTVFCDRRGIIVSNVPSYGEATVAEHVFALLLTISHHMVDAIERTRSGNFHQAGLQGFDLAGKTLGVVGTGMIGRHVIRIARGFGMKVLAYDLTPDKEWGVDYVDLPALLNQSDIITLHVPGGTATRHMIGVREFAAMKKGAVLINTARGSVVDVEALAGALASGHLAAAGLDVLPEEPAIKEEAELLRAVLHEKHDLKTLLLDHVLLRMKNVFITPHSAFNTREAIGRILDVTHRNIGHFLDGRPVNCVGQITPVTRS